MSRSDPQVNFRMPAELKARLESSAVQNRRSITAELIARLEETFAIEAVFDEVAPGAPVAGSAAFIRDLHDQLEAYKDEGRVNATASAAEVIEREMSTFQTLPYLTAILALQHAYPDSTTDKQRREVLAATGSLVGSHSKDPAETLAALSKALITLTLEEGMGL